MEKWKYFLLLRHPGFPWFKTADLARIQPHWYELRDIYFYVHPEDP